MGFLEKPLVFLRALIAQSRVQVFFVLKVNPVRELLSGFFQSGELLQPQKFFFQGPHKALGFSITLGIVKAGKDLFDIQSGGHFQEGPEVG